MVYMQIIMYFINMFIVPTSLVSSHQQLWLSLFVFMTRSKITWYYPFRKELIFICKLIFWLIVGL